MDFLELYAMTDRALARAKKARELAKSDVFPRNAHDAVCFHLSRRAFDSMALYYIAAKRAERSHYVA